MNSRRFRVLADAYGGDVTRWPEAERQAALNLLEARPHLAVEVLAGAMRLDAALDALPQPRPSEGLKERVLAAAMTIPAGAGAKLWRRWLARAGVAFGLAAVCASGFAVGTAAAHVTAEDRRADAALSEIAPDAPGSQVAPPAGADRT